MATLDLQEQEQVDAFKHWWKDNGTWLLLLLVLALGGLAATKGWQSYKDKQANEAATLFAELNKQISSNDPKRINDAAAAVIDHASNRRGLRRPTSPSESRGELTWKVLA